MKLGNPFRQENGLRIEQKPEDVKVGGLGGLIREVWSAPALYNRETRRRARLWGRIWKWDRELLGIIPADLPPRYVRRHFTEFLLSEAKTRRERRHRARILRAMQPYGGTK